MKGSVLLTYAWIDLERGQRSILDWGFMFSICSLRLSLSMAGPEVTAVSADCTPAQSRPGRQTGLLSLRLPHPALSQSL